MRKNSILLFILATMAISFTSCSEDEKPAPTALEITVLDNAGSPVKGAQVELHDANDQSVEPIVLATGISDVNGKCLFNKELKSMKYAYIATISNETAGGCKFGSGITENPIVTNKKTSVNLTTEGFGALVLDNISTTTSYNVYIKSNDVFELKYSNFTPTIMPTALPLYIGEHVFKFVEMDGTTETSNSFETTYTVSECGATKANFGN